MAKNRSSDYKKCAACGNNQTQCRCPKDINGFLTQRSGPITTNATPVDSVLYKIRVDLNNKPLSLREVSLLIELYELTVKRHSQGFAISNEELAILRKVGDA